jgi:frataxin-like iron-binding protein CyaY
VKIDSEEELHGIEVMDISGKIFLLEATNTKTYILNLQQANQGIYFVKLKFSDGRTITKKIVKQ